MKTMKWIFAAFALVIAGAANAGVSATVTGVTDYDFRGISLNGKEATIQASLDVANDNGWYAGAWGSKIDFGNCCGENFEVDYYAGYGWGSEDGPTWDIGAVWYSYPSADIDGENLDYPEAHVAMTYKWVTGKVWYSWDYNSTGNIGYYAEGNVSVPMPAELSFDVHGGYSFGQYWNNIDSEYYDWSVGLSRDFGHFSVALKWIDGSDLDDLDDTDPGSTADHNIFSTDPKVFLSIATTFPWGD